MTETQIRVTIENLAPEGGTFITPMWVGVHTGGFDLYNFAEAISPSFESLVEDGDTSSLSADFAASDAGIVERTVAGSAGIEGVIDPGEIVSTTLTFDSEVSANQFFSYASMVIPSNDAFVANGDQTEFPIFDEEGNFIEQTILIPGADVFDGGTEVNDELAENTAFFSQETPNTGEDEDGVVNSHPGFIPGGRILSEDGTTEDAPAAFNNAQFIDDEFDIARITLEEIPPPELIEVTVTIENLAPEGGTFLTPFWVGFHDGDFDTYDRGRPISTGLESLVEDGDVIAFSEEFSASGDGTVDGEVVSPEGAIDPGETVTATFTIDANADTSQFFSYASMVIPSNDAFVANGDPTSHALFGEEGNFVGTDFLILGSNVLDGGTEVNDELAENTAFFSQAAPNTGETENGVVTVHPGFEAEGRILSEDGTTEGAPAAFNNADFTADDYQVARVSVSVGDRDEEPPVPVTELEEEEEPEDPELIEVTVTIENLAPEGGTFLTPFWVGFHDGDFDTYDRGRPISTGLESLVEDGDLTAFSAEFLASGDGIIDGEVVSPEGAIDPRETVTATFTIDANTDTSQFFSYASMVIPSNDAFVANGDPTAHNLFDEEGNFVGADFTILGSEVLDGGTEFNTESAESTAFFSQTEPNTGGTQNGVVTTHPGFETDGRILSEDGTTEGAPAAFNNADFTADDYEIARVTVTLTEDTPTDRFELYRFRNTNFDTGTYIFVSDAEKEIIEGDENLNQVFELEGDGEPAFTASRSEGEDLSAFYRFQSTITEGTYIFVSEQERENINDNFADSFIEEGLAFYVYGADTGRGEQFSRFQNNNNGTYLFAGSNEASDIESNPNFSSVFTNEGIAFGSLD